MTQLLLEADVFFAFVFVRLPWWHRRTFYVFWKHNRRQYLATYIKVEHHISGRKSRKTRSRGGGERARVTKDHVLTR